MKIVLSVHFHNIYVGFVLYKILRKFALSI